MVTVTDRRNPRPDRRVFIGASWKENQYRRDIDARAGVPEWRSIITMMAMRFLNLILKSDATSVVDIFLERAFR
jgi:hypothetical protein